MIRHISLGAGMLASVLVIGCSSSDGVPSTGPDLSGTGRKAQVNGAITGFGSLIVDGTRYTTTDTVVDIERGTGRIDDLEVGMRVALQSEDGRALVVRYRDTLEGRVSAIDRENQQFTALGQTVVVDALTTFDDVSLATLQVNDRVEVSGALDEDGRIRASYIERDDDINDDDELIGRIGTVDSAARRFTIGALTIDYGTADIDDLPNGPIVDVLVEVEGREQTDGLFIATDVEAVPTVIRAPGDDTPISAQSTVVVGVVRDLSANGDRFRLDNLIVQVGPETQLDPNGGQTLANGRRVRVEGERIDDESIRALGLFIVPSVTVELDGTVEAVDSAAETLTLLGGFVVTMLNNTRFRDDSDDNRREFGLADIQPGDRVEIAGFVRDNAVFALRVERDDDDKDDDGDGERDDEKLSGPVSALDPAARQFVINGTTVQVTDATEFDDIEDESRFFAQVQPGDRVEAEGRFDAATGVFIAAEIEPQDAGDFDDDFDDDDADDSDGDGDGDGDDDDD
ncbi:MAG: DUF5666 domain-containing protein [Oceanococcaceae bacterium]